VRQRKILYVKTTTCTWHCNLILRRAKREF